MSDPTSVSALARRLPAGALSGLSLLLVGLLATLSAVPATGAVLEDYRPVYHYSPARNFSNDPNGLIWHDGTYHLFYQTNPYGPDPGNGSWGHATSPDLVHWTERPLAITTDAEEDVWSGSVVFDRANSSGLGTTANPPLVAVYTSYQRATRIQRQSLAFSTDGGLTWTKYAGNPVLDIGSTEFRDPKVFWDAARARWTMVVSLAVEHKVAIYTSTNLKQWTRRSEFGPAGATGGPWECPDLFPLTLDGRERWVLTVSLAGRTQYFVGDFDGSTFSSPDTSYAAPAATRVLADFEGADYGDWTTTGTAFGSGPVVPNPDILNVQGSKAVDSWGGGDPATGTLTSPEFTVDAPYLNFLLAGGRHPWSPGGSDAPPPGEVLADFEGEGYGPGWTTTGDFDGTGPVLTDLPGHVGAKALDTCVKACDPSVGTITSPEFTITRDWVNLLVAGGDHPLGGPEPTAVSLLVDGRVVATATGRNSPQLDWTAWHVAAYRGRTARIQVTDQRIADWGHLMLDHIVLSDAAAGPWNLSTAANLIVDGRVVRTATGEDGPALDWRSWDLRDLQGRRARVQFVDRATGGWGHLMADQVVLADRPARSAAERVRWVDHGRDDYAGVTWNDTPDDRRVRIGWMSNWEYAPATPTVGWRGEQTVPRVLELERVDGRPTLRQTPVDLSSLAVSRTRLTPRSLTGGWTLPVAGRAYRMDLTLAPGTAARLAVDVRVGSAERTRIAYDARAGLLSLDRTASGNVGFSPAFPAVHTAPLDLAGRPLRLTVLVDESSVEVFADGGRVVFTDLVFPHRDSRQIRLVADGGTAWLTEGAVTRYGPAISR